MGNRIGFVGLLIIVFITLKLTNFITWSWWWVLSPIWILAMIIIGALLAIFVYLLYADGYFKPKKADNNLND